MNAPTPHSTQRPGFSVFGAFIDAVSWPEALDRLVAWGETKESRYICICNVHSVITATQEPSHMASINGADMATADGEPVAWTLRRNGYPTQPRINGPDLMWKYLSLAQDKGQVVSLYGSTPETLDLLLSAMKKQFPRLQIGVAISPPFRPLTDAEKSADIARIHEAGTHVLFVGLGCPKQEKWMADHRGLIQATMVGVGAAFDYHAGTITRAPLWMQRHGLEWVHRLFSEPRRLFKRYLVTNSLFVLKTLQRGWRSSE